MRKRPTARTWLLIAAAAAAVVAARPAQAYRYSHEVLPGERIQQIARRYHVPPKQILRLNRLRPGKLRAGQQLKIVTSVPSRTRRKVKVVVQPGDTLSRVAKRHGLKTALLRALNARQLRRGRGVLRPGQQLVVVVEGPSPDGGVKGLYQMDSGPGYKMRSPARSWGTFLTVTRLHDVLSAYANRFPGAAPVRVLDISQRGGGEFAPHKSHRGGRDVDVAYVLKGGHKEGTPATPARLDVRRSWYLVKRFVDTADVTYIFMDWSLQRALYEHARKQRGVSLKWLEKVFQYPRSSRANHGIIRDDPGHDTHFHVRFRRETAKPKPVS